MLLIFFLVTTSMDIDKGLVRQLPPLDTQEKEQLVDVDKRNVLSLMLKADGQLTVNDEVVDVKTLKARVMDFVNYCPDRKKHVVSVDMDRAASYGDYFTIQNEIVAAYNQLRDDRAYRLYHKSLTKCTVKQQESIIDYFPQRIAEVYNTQKATNEEGGGE